VAKQRKLLVDTFADIDSSSIIENIDIQLPKNTSTPDLPKGIIGHIGGIGANSNSPTRNGRRYPIELWRNVQHSEYFIEGMDARTIIGECDHPEERVDYSVKEGAVVLSRYDVQNDGLVYTEFDILDTIHGRTVKTYFDAGCKLGVSSRGLGEEMEINSETIIDPDSYQFYCFDVVAFPAVKTARMELLESTSPKRIDLINKITKEINECVSINDVQFIKRIHEKVELNLNEINEAINIKIKELTLTETMNILKEDETTIDITSNDIKEDEININDTENNKIKISDTITTSDVDTSNEETESEMIVLMELKQEIEQYKQDIITLKNECDLQKKVIKSLVSNNYKLNETNTLLQQDNTKINESYIKVQTNRKQAIKQLVNFKNENKLLHDKLSAVNEKYTRLQNVNNELSTITLDNSKSFKQLQIENNKLSARNNNLLIKVESLSQMNQKLQEKQKSLNESSNKQFTKKIETLTEKNNIHLNEIKALTKVNAEITTKLNNIKTENVTIKNQYNDSLKKYINEVCIKYDLKESTLLKLLGNQYTIQDIDNVAHDLIENQNKINSLPFNKLIPERKVIIENVGLDDTNAKSYITEQLDTFSFSINSKKS